MSMTGQGVAASSNSLGDVQVLIRSVNNRHLKMVVRAGEMLQPLESKIESLVRKQVQRGSVQVSLQIDPAHFESKYRLDEKSLSSYFQQCQDLANEMGGDSTVRVVDLLHLPGVVADVQSGWSSSSVAELESLVMEVVEEATNSLIEMRRSEGLSMKGELVTQLGRLRDEVEAIRNRGPEVITEYQARLTARIEKALAELGQSLNEGDLARELLLMVDRSDIREELVRLDSHFQQFEDLLESETSQGRKLDFLIQEMFREANTIGAKASDAVISQRIVEVKATLEQMRELVQNIE